MRELILKTEHWPVKGSFTISRSSLKEIIVVTARITDNGHRGWGECRPYARYNETAESVIKDIENVRRSIETGVSNDDLLSLLPAGAARNVIDCALWDLKAKQTRKTVSELLNLSRPQQRITAYTLSINSPAQMRIAAQKAMQYPILKIKIGGPEGLKSCIAILDARPDAQLIIDANEALKVEDIKSFKKQLKGLPIIMIEQPIPAGQDKLIPYSPNELPILCADESLHTENDLDRLWSLGYRAINVKLDKCGGLTAGLSLMKAAKSKGFIIMAGCMVGTSLAMAPMMILESYADYIDLDGPLLLAKDRDNKIIYESSNIIPASPKLWG